MSCTADPEGCFIYFLALFAGAYARTWLKSVKATGAHTESRNYKLFGTNSNGYNVFLSRYLTAQQPPKGYESRRACIHLISNIPFMNDAQSFLGEMDLWCTSSQFWEIGMYNFAFLCVLYPYNLVNCPSLSQVVMVYTAILFVSSSAERRCEPTAVFNCATF